MSLFHYALLLLVAISTVFAASKPNSARKKPAFSLKTNGGRAPWRNQTSVTSQFSRRDPVAVSQHVDPQHYYAWTPIQLGGAYTCYG